MEKELKKLMFSAMRCVTYLPGEGEATAEAMTRAMTVNENLTTLGYTLTPADVIRLAVSPSLDGFYEEVREFVGEVKADPMYPGFPEQVMEMSEAQYRFDQICHYLSTYGIEAVLGVKVAEGWLPDGDQPKKKRGKAPARLLKAQTLELLDETDAVFTLASRILGRRERMTLQEKELTALALSELSAEELEKLEIPFKENLMGIFVYLVTQYTDRESGEEAFRILRALCQHTGDVLRGTVRLLAYCKYHLRTSRKRFVVKLLESYPETDFKSNLILSRKKAEKNLLVLQYLDYNLYSRSAAHKEAVRALRNGELHSWEGQARYLLSAKEDGALSFVAARPGMMLRMVAWLLRLGYPAQEIEEKLIAGAEKLSAQTLVTILTCFGDPELPGKKLSAWVVPLDENAGYLYSEKKRAQQKRIEQEIDAVYGVIRNVLVAKMKAIQTPLDGKKVFLDLAEYDLAHSELQCNAKSEEGGYIRSGIAYKIPEGVDRLRFFVYWNDRERVDIDLHAGAHTIKGEEVNVGWNADFRREGIVMSGDITHSDAAEYIDVDLTKPLREVGLFIILFDGKESFGEIETCFTGMMAVKKLGEDVKLYDPANCFFSHELRGSERQLIYGYVDVVNRCLVFVGKENKGSNYEFEVYGTSRFSLKDYLDELMTAKGVTVVETRDEADVVLRMGKAEAENELSLIDHNFFLDN